MIGTICISAFKYYDNVKHRMAFNHREWYYRYVEGKQPSRLFSFSIVFPLTPTAAAVGVLL